MADLGNITKITLPSGDVVHFKDNVSGFATTTYVDDSIAALPEPMLFKGSVGTDGTVTWANLPAAAASNEGFTYKVITAHSAETGKPAAKVGDTIISTGSEWVVIPSGDEPSGTVTSVTIKATSPIAVDSTSAITSSGTRTLSHENSGATAGSYGDSSAQTPDYGSTFKVPYITVNATGHVTGISEHTVKIPASDNTNTTYTLTNALASHKYTWTLTPSSGSATTTSAELVEGNGITLTDDTTNKKITVAAKLGYTTSGNNRAVTADSSGNLYVVQKDSDTNYYHKTGSWSGLTYTAAKVGSPDDLAFTIPTGTTATTVAVGNHTHTTSIATSSDTNQITLAHGTKYAITAGGTSYVFTMPSDNNNYVNQSSSTTANWRKLLLHYKDDSSATAAVTNSTNVVYGAVGIAAQPSTGTIRASVYRVADNVELQYNSTTKSLDFVFL